MRPNRLKQRLAAGETVIGVLLSFNSPELVELCGALGLDYVLIDGEHGLAGPETCQHLVRAADAAGISTLVRVPRNEPTTILAYLETGVQGVMVPHVRTAEDAQAAVRAVKYPPAGARSAGASSRAAGFGVAQAAPDYFRTANKETMVIALVEEMAGFRNLEAIGATPGVDLLYFGDGDLAADMGFPGQRDHPAVRALMADALHHGLSAGLALGGPAGNAAAARQRIASGMRFVCVPLVNLVADAGRALLAEAGVSRPPGS
jgi:4-hydroxy-2-oxoheptanedioate aldolase